MASEVFTQKPIMDYEGKPVPTFDSTTRKRILYDNGLPFTGGRRENGQDRHAYNLDKLKERVDNRKATLLIIDGTGLGEGKTTFAVHHADYFEGRWIKFPEQIYMGGEKFIKGIKVCFEKGYVVIVYDESGDFDKRGALSRLNKTLGRVFDIFRAFKIIVVLVLPTFLVLDNSLFDKNLPRMLVHCHTRSKNQGNFDVYDLSRMLWIRYNSKNAVIKQDAFKKVQPNYRGHFLDLTPKRSKELDLYSTKGKLDVVDLAEIRGEGLLTYPEIASRCNRTNEWVRRKVSALKIQAVKVYKGKKYFSEDDFNRIKRAAK